MPIKREIAEKSKIPLNLNANISSAVKGNTLKKSIGAFSFVKMLDKSSPKLSLACADGTHINSVVVELCRAGGDKLKFMEYKLTNCMISKIATAGGPGDFPSEVLKIVFGKIEWRYVIQKRTLDSTLN